MTNKPTVVITGATSGIGFAIAQQFVSEGYQLILHGRNQKKLEEILASLQKIPNDIHIVTADLALFDQRKYFLQEITRICGCPDVLINNAGFGYYGYFHKMPLHLAKDMTQVMVDAILEIDHYFIPKMLERGTGHILHISSIIGALPNQGVSMYSSIKAFMDCFCTSLYRELHGSGVIVSMIRPGPVKSAFFERAKELENGGKIPGDILPISANRVAAVVLKNVRHPRRVRYVPGWVIITKFWEPFFGWFVDLLGPILLKKGH